MIEKTGNIWSVFQQPNQIVLCTTNNVRGRNGLVMGAGIAREAAQRLPELSRWMDPYCGADYWLKVFYGQGIGCIQTKRDWKHGSPIDLVHASIEILNIVANTDQTYTYNLTRPGCGLGGLNWERDVRPMCNSLPNNCVVWSQ